MSSLIQYHAHVKGQRSNHHIFKFQPNPSWAKKRPNRYTSFSRQLYFRPKHVKRHIYYLKNSRIRHDLPTSVNESVFAISAKFREHFRNYSISSLLCAGRVVHSAKIRWSIIPDDSSYLYGIAQLVHTTRFPL